MASHKIILGVTGGIAAFKAAELTAGGASGQVDTSSVITYLQVRINGVRYAIPAYGIRP